MLHNLGRFVYKNRFLRIYPLYIFAIILYVFVDLSNITTSLKAAVFISMFVKPALPTLWFISMVMLFYIASPLVIVACRKIPIDRLVLYCAFLILCLLTYEYLTKLLDVRVVMYFPSFVLGVFVANNNDKLITENKYILLVLLAISILFSFLNTNRIFNIPMILLCSFLLFKIVKEIAISSHRAHRITILMSYSSYCMYLFHRPIYAILKIIYFPETYLFQVVYLAMFCLPFVIMTSFIIQKLYDIINDTLTNKFSGHKKSIPLI